MYKIIPVWMTVDSRGWAFHVYGKPPYIVTEMLPRDPFGFTPFSYICPGSPCPIEGWRADEQFQVMYENQRYKDLMFCYPDDVIDAKDYDVLMKYYDRRIKDQVESLLSALDWDKVKVEQQSQFVQGIRVARTVPLVGLKMCLDAYDFDDFWANINWADPRTYLGAVKEVIGLVSGASGAVQASRKI